MAETVINRCSTNRGVVQLNCKHYKPKGEDGSLCYHYHDLNDLRVCYRNPRPKDD